MTDIVVNCNHLSAVINELTRPNKLNFGKTIFLKSGSIIILSKMIKLCGRKRFAERDEKKLHSFSMHLI